MDSDIVTIQIPYFFPMIFCVPIESTLNGVFKFYLYITNDVNICSFYSSFTGVFFLEMLFIRKNRPTIVVSVVLILYPCFIWTGTVTLFNLKQPNQWEKKLQFFECVFWCNVWLCIDIHLLHRVYSAKPYQ